MEVNFFANLQVEISVLSNEVETDKEENVMDVKTAWGSKWIGASSPDAALIASSRNTTHNAANALDTEQKPVHAEHK